MSAAGDAIQSGATKKLKIALVVLAYFVVSISLVFSNKLLLSSKGSTIEAPLFVTWFQVRTPSTADNRGRARLADSDEPEHTRRHQGGLVAGGSLTLSVSSSFALS